MASLFLNLFSNDFHFSIEELSIWGRIRRNPAETASGSSIIDLQEENESEKDSKPVASLFFNFFSNEFHFSLEELSIWGRIRRNPAETASGSSKVDLQEENESEKDSKPVASLFLNLF